MSLDMGPWTGKWVVEIKGSPKHDHEITVVRKDYKLGFESWGWFHQDAKRLIATADFGAETVGIITWKKLIQVANEVAEHLNQKDQIK